jgi:hypothetical protein
MTDKATSRRRLILGALMAAVGLAVLPADAEAQGRGWGPDGMGPPGQQRRRRSGLWVLPGRRRRRERWIAPGYRRRRSRRGW